ncbi:DUF411 domain-containing protein [Chitinimonas lacunae]|uniref:DUF411 domain-containing protein n=1 Tax=Chitinimonas lacunae TaxID=1963018 RepID=A0ABV8MWM1_9NEIS
MSRLSLIALALLATATQAAPREGTLYKSPTCGCCAAHAVHLREQGWVIREVATQELAEIKQRYGTAVAPSCHTLLMAGYAIEGHVPAAAIERLLREKPASVRALSVPGMPAHSPGMGAYTPGSVAVLAIDHQGKTRPWGKF